MNHVNLRNLLVLGVFLCAAARAEAQTDPPHIMVLVDTSGSMLEDLDGDLTGGDGSSSVTAWGNTCCPGWDEDGVTGPDGYDSRLYIAKDVLTDVVWSVGVGELVFGLATYWQDEYPGWTRCNENRWASYFGNGDGDCDTVVDGYNEDRISFRGVSCSSSSQDTGRIVVEYSADDTRRDELLSWIDHHEESYADEDCDGVCAGYECVGGSSNDRGCFVNPELRAIGGTPLSHAVDRLTTYFNGELVGNPCEQFAVVLTDGAQSDDCRGDEATAVDNLADEGVTVYVIAFALSDSLMGVMDDMAFEGGTSYARRANSRNELRAAFAEIIEDAIQVEVCNGEDDDCDGDIDEDLFRPCDTDCGDGQEACDPVAGEWDEDSCDAPPVEDEICDNIDNDCDGQVDEGLTQACSNECGDGTETCQNGAWVGCTAPTGGGEVCDGIDNDCDGDIDESDPLVGTTCGTDIGECTEGVWECDSGSLQCTGNMPIPEECNNLDDDCNGVVDDELTQPCTNGPCNGTERCRAGVWDPSTCNALTPSAEVCDNVDNDCDGEIDNFTQACDLGCGPGTRLCTAGAWEDCSVPAPTAEICDNLDNDCDGVIDEDVFRACSLGSCTGEEQCEAGGWFGCTAASSTEICDNIDNDCDGETDELTPRTCSTACGDGLESCLGGLWRDCSAPAPEPEECDGVDNDCDGSIDENVRRTCLVGACSGSQICEAPYVWGDCQVLMREEVCDGEDNDCDGDIDEDLTRACATACGTGSQSCAGGTWSTCDAPAPEVEICNGLDEDCNGLIDDGVTRPCSTICGDGVETCVDGDWGPCSSPEPTDEFCNGIDDDCDGEIDEYDSDIGEVCGTDEGECDPGTYDCIGGILECVDDIEPTPERCDLLDNDCDGLIDEGLPLDEPCCIDADGCLGQLGDDIIECECEEYSYESTASCVPGHFICEEGELVCEGFGWPSDEDCDCIDNDCNGFVDDGLPLGDACGTDEGECDPGYEQCVECAWRCVGGVDPTPEICDLLDNDCDGEIDEDSEFLCPDEDSVCIEGECALPCGTGEFPCPPGKACQNGFCLGDPCQGVQCGECQRCNSGTGECEDMCAGITCESGTFCECGRCYPDNCYYRGCDDGAVCQNGECIVDPCADVSCSAGEFCREGECFGVCTADVVCPAGQECRDGACVADPCHNVTCGSGERCVAETGECSDACRGISCPQGRVCDPATGSCIDSPCLSVSCPDGTHCDSGSCVADNVTDGDAGPIHAPMYVLGTGGGGCACSTASTTTNRTNLGLMVLILSMLLVRRFGRKS